MPTATRILLDFRNVKAGRGRLMRYPMRERPEQLEPRTLLSAAPIQFGAVYTEQDFGSDSQPDTIEISFVGGASDTQLTRIEIDGDKFTAGLSLADMIFDTEDAGLGVDLPHGGSIESRAGDFNAEIFVEDGSSKVILQLNGFDPGERLTLAIDVDEVQGFNPHEAQHSLINEDLDPIASGAEFQGSQLTAYFAAPHFLETEGTAEFRNRYDENLDATALQLPRDDDGGARDRTAGAVGQLVQTPLPISISGVVYEDRNANLNQDVGDPGMLNVELALFVQQNGSYVFTGHTVSTNSQGEYSFDATLGLLPGTYEIREKQPDSFFSVGAEIGEVEGIRTGTIRSFDILSVITIPYGGVAARNYNFAEARPASIRGRVHLSTPEGDCWDTSIAREPVAGVAIQLVNAAGGTVAETKTDAHGRYEFFNLRPGEYALIELTPDHLFAGGARAGNVVGVSRGKAEDSRIREIELFSGDDGVDYEFCDHEPATLAGSVYHDRNDDGSRDGGEEGIAGAILSLLDESDSIVDAVETDEAGHYEFIGVRAGNYRVIELQPHGWLDGKDRVGTVDDRPKGTAINPGDTIEAINLLWGDVGVDYDFGELKPSSLQGRVHLSTPDGDCWNLDEGLLEPVAGAIVQLLDATGQVLAEAVTDDDGNYEFGGLVPGDYSIREITPDGLQDGGARAGRIDGNSRGRVDESGDITGVRLGSDEAGSDYDFCEHKPAVISGYVFEDDDNDGIRDAGEAPIARVVVQLFDDFGKLVAETQTDEKGRYVLDGIPPGNYSLHQIQPQDYFDGTDSVGTVDGQRRGQALNPGDRIIDIRLGWGETGEEYNFGELRPASLFGSVHSSPNENCWEDENAEALAGIRILLFGEDGRTIAETLTDAQGRYSFEELAPGTYRLVQEQPATSFHGGQRAGTSGGDASQTNQITGIDLAPGAAAMEYDFCEKPPATISGFVFVDGEPIPLADDETLPQDVSSLRDGKRTEDDTPLAAVKLELRNGISGIAIDATVALPGFYPDGPIETTTDQGGFYEFGGLPNGNYSVYEIQPDGYIDGIDSPGTTNGIAINPLTPDDDDIFIETVMNSLVVPPANDAIVRIGLPPGVHSQQNNFSEVLTVVNPLIAPPNDPPPSTPLSPAQPLELPELYQYRRDPAPLPLQENRIPDDGSYSGKSNSWHLSVIDGGQPRVSQKPDQTSYLFPASLWQQHRLSAAKWEIAGQNGDTEVYYFGLENGHPVTGDFDGDGSTEIGVFLKGHWFIDLNGNGRWDSQDLWAKLGFDGDMPVVGDWDGDGKDDIGIFGRAWPGDTVAIRYEHGLPDMDNVTDGERKNMPPRDDALIGRRVMKHTARGRLRTDVIDHVFLYGTAGDVGIVGDWNGDGIDTMGVFRAGEWRLDVDGNGHWTDPDEAIRFGGLGDIPLVGDFNGDGIDDLAIIRNGKIYIDANRNRRLDSNDLVIDFDETKGVPVVGKWGSSGADHIGMFQSVDQDQISVASRPETE